ncbi:alpha/beta hydrolase fold domain-containing protein [Pontiellaceae bacterium B12227]|nr:alpha/beta hydrolase fold domain-containing protein [Pontiellaceae bacterium B12227]
MSTKSKMLGCGLAVLFAGCISSVYGQKPAEQEILDTYQYKKDIVYKTVGGRKLSLVYFKPQNLKAGEKAPWMLFVHGGGWRGGNKYNILRSAFEGTLKQLTENGVACFTIDYRLTKNHVTAFDSVVDCKDAARFLLKNASTYNLDLERYGVWGGSAGGHLSLMTALGHNEDFKGDAAFSGFEPDFKCVASYYPLTTLLNRDVLIGSKFEDPEVLRHVLDGLFSEKPELARLLSPTEYLSKDTPPILLLHGEKDPILSIKNSYYMMEVAKKNGAAVELLPVKNATHSFGGKNISPSMEEINETSARFILSRLTGRKDVR